MDDKIKKKEFLHKSMFLITCIFSVSYVIACIYLFYMQASQSIVDIEAGSHLFESDLPYHIKMAVVDGWYYSATGILYKLCFMLPASEFLVALILGLAAGVTVYYTYQLIDKYVHVLSKAGSMVVALCLNFMMAAHWDFGHTQWYIGYESANLWHNSTYLLMRLFALMSIHFYIRLKESYKIHLPYKEAIIFALLLAISTAVKPSFVVVFLPTMAVLLLIDLVKGVPFKKVVLFALTVVPSLVFLIIQEMILFGESTESGIVFDPWFTLSLHANHPKVTLLLSILFPLLVLLFSLKEIFKDQLYLGAWIMWLFGFLQMLLLTEVGTRANAGNFIWGYSFAIFILNLVSVMIYIKKIYTKKYYQQFKWVKKIYVLVVGFAFLYQTYCGIQFFIWMMQGKTYWI